MRCFKIVFISMLGASSLVAQADTAKGWYVGVTGGQSKNKFESKDTSKIMVPGSLSTIKDTDFSPSLFAGYQFNKTFGIEGGYTHLGNYRIHVTMPGGLAIAEKYNVDAWHAAATASLHIDEQLALFAKVGLVRTHVKDTYKFNTSDKQYKFTKTRINPLLGVGVKYSINPQWSLRLEYEYFGKVGSAITPTGEGTARARNSRISAGVTHHF